MPCQILLATFSQTVLHSDYVRRCVSVNAQDSDIQLRLVASSIAMEYSVKGYLSQCLNVFILCNDH